MSAIESMDAYPHSTRPVQPKAELTLHTDGAIPAIVRHRASSIVESNVQLISSASAKI